MTGDDENTLLTGATQHVAAMLEHLQQEALRLRAHQASAAHKSRQYQRSLDELSVQLAFAQERGSNKYDSLLAEQQQLRVALAQEDVIARQGIEAVKRLEQLIHQMEMSSTILYGHTTTPITDDPWSLALRGQVIHGREEERIRLAREVHDGPAQVLANVLMGLEHCLNLVQRYPEQLEGFLPELRDAARTGLGEIRTFIADLRPGALEHGLMLAIQEYVQKYNQKTSIHVSLDLDHWPKTLSKETEIVIYRVLQEALQNINKHARNAQVTIRSLYQQHTLTIIIRDTGPGFDPREVAQRTGKQSWGLTSMRERVALIGGDFSIASRRGAGTEVMLRIPV